MDFNKQQSQELERTLGLRAALAIGVGTMVGAGIFVFPGIAGGAAGPGAMISFTLGGLIALLVAVSTAELATAMPNSGGGYYFISRTFGPLAGSLVGISQWAGLTFAGAFYLVGFGQYVIDLLRELELSPGDLNVLIALAAALILTTINLIGTEGVGRLQNRIVVTLTAVLALLFGYGVLQATGLIGDANWPTPFLPNGLSPVFTTTALIFTSYLGFVQIATVGGEIKNPQRNLPYALLGSVLIVLGLYILAIFVSSTVFSSERLAELGETAMIEVARQLIGRWGAMAILAAGLLATLSSANASILSSSRAIYALGKDNLLPEVIGRVNTRFGTPYIALLLVGLPTAGFILLGRIDILAEVASLLHLIIYGLICVALIQLRRTSPLWYAPTFRTPGGVLLPGVGAVACFGLISLMQPLSLAISAGILLLSFSWYFFYSRETSLPSPQPIHILPDLRHPRILVPIQVPEPDPLPDSLLRAFHQLDLLILGYRLIPEQTSPDQSREKFGDEAEETLAEIAADLEAHNINVEFNLVFTPNFSRSVNRYIDEALCHAVLTAKPIGTINRLLVPIYTPDQVNRRLMTILHDLALSSDLPVTIVVLSSEERETETVQEEKDLEQWTIQRLTAAGLQRNQIHSSSTAVADVVEAVTELTGEDDVVILSEPRDFDRNRFFNSLHDAIETAVTCPILVVLHQQEEELASRG